MRKTKESLKVMFVMLLSITILIASTAFVQANTESQVTFNTNGGTILEGEISTYIEGTETILPTNVVKLGHTFEGWYENSDLTGNAITKIDASATGDKTYYAKWQINFAKMGYAQIAAGMYQTLTIDESGNLWSWGLNNDGQVGNGTQTDTLNPTQIMPGTKFTQVATGNLFCLALDENGNIWSFGTNGVGQLGQNGISISSALVKIASETTFTKIAVGSSHGLAIDTNNKLWAWGLNSSGQLGNGTTNNSNTPIQIMSNIDFAEITAGYNSSAAISTNGDLYTWGANEEGQLGDGTNEASNTPKQIETSKTFTKVEMSKGENYTFAIDNNGKLYAWGSNQYGELGNETFISSNTPVEVMPNKTITKITAGYNHALAIDSEGKLYAWGANGGGKLGTGDEILTNTPIQISKDKTFKNVSAGWNHTIAIDSRGSLYVWGGNENGELGTGDNISQKTPNAISIKEDYSYRVQHYKQTEEGYELVDEDIENTEGGMRGQIVTATPKNYDGYIWNKYAIGTRTKGNIQENGSLVLKLYYDKLLENNFNINLTNKNAENSEEIANSKYDITVEYCDGTTLEFKDKLTDENGNITLENVVGKNVMRVYFKQTQVATGFNSDTSEKYVEINNETSKIKLTGAKSSGIIASTEDNTLYITQLNYELNYENTIRINAVDNIDSEIGLGGVSYEIIYPEGKTKSIVTDEEGIAEINNLKAPGVGNFMYEIKQINSLSGYNEKESSIYLNIEFNEAGIIKTASILKGDNVEASVIKEQEGTLENVIANIKIEQQRNEQNGIFGDYTLHIIEEDKESNEPIEGVTYKIIEKATTEGLSNVATVTKKTNSLGQINTYLAEGNQIALTIKRTKVPNGYKLVKEEIKVILVKNEQGQYELQEPVEGVNIDNTTKTITINRKLYKTTSIYNEAKTKVNNEIFITKVDSLYRPLQGVVLELRENETNAKWELKTDDNGLAKITNEDIVNSLGSEFPQYLKEGKGKLTFWITEKSVPVGYENIDEDIGFEAYYEITPEGTLEISYMNVLDGLSYYHIVDQEYDQYEKEDYMQVDIRMKVVNKYGTDVDQANLNTLKIEKVDSENTNKKLKNATFQITLTYPTKGKLRTIETTNIDGIINVPSLYFPEGTTNIEIVEKTAPYGYVLDTTPVNISVTNSSGNITVNGANIDSNGVISVQLDNTQKEREVPFNVVINKRDSKTKELIDNIADFAIQITKNGTTNTYNRTTRNGVTGVYGLNGKGNITIKVKETEAPFGYKINNDTFVANITKENLLSNINETNSSNNVQVVGNTIYVTVYNQEQDASDILPTLQIRKVDNDNTYLGLQGAKFKITIPDERGTTRNVVTSLRGYASVILSNGISGRYIIEETEAPYGYYLTKKIALDIVFDSNKNITSCNIVQDLGDEYLNSVYSFTKTDKRIYITIGNEDIKRVTNPIDTYTIKINKVSKTDKLYKLNGAVFDIDINQQEGLNYSVIRETKYYRGAYVSGLTGTGKIKVDLREIEAPFGYKYDGTLRSLAFYRDPTTKNLVLDTSSLRGLSEDDIQVNNINHTITITVKNTPLSGTIEVKPGESETIGGGVIGGSTGGSGTIGGGSGGAGGSGGSGGSGSAGGGPGGSAKPTPGPSPITPNPETTDPDFGIQIEKVNKYNNKIKVPGAEYAVYIENEDTKQSSVKIVTTDNKGQISFRGIIGYGNFKITLIETESPETYSIDEKAHVIRVHRDKESLIITPIETNVGENVKVRVDNINKVVKVAIEEAPSTIGFAILKQDYEDEEIGLKNSKFQIVDDETNNVYELKTLEEGMGYVSLPIKENGWHNFTLREIEAPVGYNALTDNFTLKVNYLNGLIAEAQIIGNDELAYITKQNTEYIEANILNKKIEEGIKYDIELIKADAYYSSIIFENAKIKMDIDHEVGIQGLTKTTLTNSEGKININNIYGSGKATIKITEIEPPLGRRFDTKEKQVILNIDSETGWIKLDKETSNVDVFVDNDTKKVTIRIRNYPDGTFVIGANKVDNVDNDLMLYGAKYQLQMEGSSTKYTLTQYANGLLALTDIPMPSQVGTYRYIIQETEAPFGYKLDTTPIILSVQVSKVNGIKKITKATIESGNASVETYGDEFVHLKLEDTINDITEPSANAAYNITINKVDNIDKTYFIADTLIGVHVQAESGENYYKQIKTDAFGQINLNNITGTGKITVTLEEIEAAPNYQISNGKKTIVFTRNPGTKEITIEENTDSSIEINAEEGNINITLENTLNLEKAFITTVRKVWVDTETQKIHRPTSIKIQIKNGEKVVQEKEISNTQETAIFTNLPKYDEDGNEIQYTIAEKEVNAGALKYYVTSYDVETNTIINTFRVPEEIANEKTTVTVHPKWEDTETQKDKRPDEIKIIIKDGDNIVGEKVIGTGTNEGVIIEGLPKYDGDGNEIEYEIEVGEVNEGDLKFYIPTIEKDEETGDITIKNTFTVPEEIANEKTSITAHKVWIDTEAQRIHRPENIKIQVKNGDTIVKETTIEGNADKEIVFGDLPKYDENGNEIIYTVNEAEITEGDLGYYVSSIDVETNTITNTFTVPEEVANEKVDITAKKVWVDTEEQKAHRPENIKIQVKNGDKVVNETIISASQDQEVTFEDLPKYDENGNEIMYVVSEAEINEKDLQYYLSSYDAETKTITNTYIVNAKIRKISKSTKLGLQGAKIVLIDENGQETTGTTNEEGYVTFIGLQKGKTYTYKEVEAPIGYVLNTNVYTLTVNEDGSITYGENGGIIENERIKVNVGIIKYEEGTTKPVQGAKIAIYDVNGNAVIGTNGKEIVVTTNEQGQVTFEGLEPGTYEYKEIEAPIGYLLNENTYTFTIDEKGNVTHGENRGIIYNKKIRSNVVITKYIKGTNIPLEGAIIGLFDKNGNALNLPNGEQIKAITGQDGKITIINLEVGTYCYKELEAPVGYILNEEMYTVTVNNDGSISYGENGGIIYNEKITKDVTIIKYEEGTTKPVQGAKIGLFDQNGNPLTNKDGAEIILTTNENGQVTFIGLEAGTYQYKEIEAPEGYVLNRNVYTFTIDQNGNVTYGESKGIIYNKKITTNVIIHKYIAGTNIPLEGATIGLFDKNGTPLTNENGTEITATTNENGQVVFENLGEGTYYYKETEAPLGYVLNDTMYTFKVEKNGNVIYGTNKGIIYNTAMKYSVAIVKYITGTEIPVQGAVIGLFDENGNPLTNQDGAEITATTNEQGQVVFENLGKGTYYYKETEAPVGYVLNEETYTFIVNKDGTITYGENNGIIYNNTVKTSVVIKKYILGTTTPLEGASITLYDAEGNEITVKQTGKDGQVLFENLEKGTYYYKETEAPTGYALNEKTYQFTINTDGTVVYGENGGIIYNDLIRANAIIKKYEEGTEIPVQGAIIGLFDENGNALVGPNGEQIKATTGPNGTITILNLTPGTYCYKELQAPVGYVLNNTMYTFTVNEKGEVIYGDLGGIIYNTPKTIDVEIIKMEKDTNKPLKGATIKLYKERQEEELQTITTGENGKGKFFGLRVGTYYYKETKAPVGYLLNNITYTFTVNADGTITYGENNGIIYNDKIRSNVVIIKYEEGTMVPVQGATIGLFDKNGNALVGQNGEQIKAITGEDGKITILNLSEGTYCYKELEAPDGYILNDTMYTFTVNVDGSITHGENKGIIYNKKKPEDPTDPVDPEDPTDPEEPDTPDTPETPDKPKDPEKPTEPDTPSKPEEPTDPNVPVNPVKPDKPNGNYTGLLPKTGETIAVLIIAVIALSSSGIILTYNYMKMRKERK